VVDMPDYKCDVCKRTMYLMADKSGRVLFCPDCTRKQRRQVKLARA
jgi:DNA-directed RNA polymerase subunit RPC12/RpoP